MDWSLIYQATTSDLIVLALLACGGIYLTVDFAIFAVNQIANFFGGSDE